jgi:hypothetical protein
MSLARVSPGPSGYDFRTFKCNKCEHVLKEMIDRSNEIRQSRMVGRGIKVTEIAGGNHAFEKSAMDDGR